jgi:hypothetical protein
MGATHAARCPRAALAPCSLLSAPALLSPFSSHAACALAHANLLAPEEYFELRVRARLCALAYTSGTRSKREGSAMARVCLRSQPARRACVFTARWLTWKWQAERCPEGP